MPPSRLTESLMPMPRLQFASSLSRLVNTADAVREATASLRLQLQGAPDLVVVFLSNHHKEKAQEIIDLIFHELEPGTLIGCNAEGIIGESAEIEGAHAISLFAGVMPEVELTPFHLGEDMYDTLECDHGYSDLWEEIGLPEDDNLRCFLLFGDPYTCPIVEAMDALMTFTEWVPIVGGMASGSGGEGENVLLLHKQVYYEGAVGMTVTGNIGVRTVLSQGCTPIGERALVTRAENDVVYSIGEKTALQYAEEVLERIPEEAQELAQNGLLIGIAMNEYQDDFDRGDFVIRNVLSADPTTGEIVIGDMVEAGQTVQYQVRDAKSADKELRRMLFATAAQEAPAPAGILLISCNGRGVSLFGEPNHDLNCVLNAFPETPLAGIHASGELGPVGGQNFIHGFTASILLFQPLTAIETVAEGVEERDYLPE